MDDRLKEAVEWGENVLRELDEGPFYIMEPETQRLYLQALLDAARTAESTESRAIERCPQHLLVISNDLRNGSRLRYHAAILSGNLRSLAPAQACVWTEEEDAPGRYHTECGHTFDVDEGFEFDELDVGFCPFKGCGRPVRVEGE